MKALIEFEACLLVDGASESSPDDVYFTARESVVIMGLIARGLLAAGPWELCANGDVAREIHTTPLGLLALRLYRALRVAA